MANAIPVRNVDRLHVTRFQNMKEPIKTRASTSDVNTETAVPVGQGGPKPRMMSMRGAAMNALATHEVMLL